jgi:hypothetical protein
VCWYSGIQTQRLYTPGGIGKAEGFADGEWANHRQAFACRCHPLQNPCLAIKKCSCTLSLLILLSVFSKGACVCMMAGFDSNGAVWGHSGRVVTI